MQKQGADIFCCSEAQFLRAPGAYKQVCDQARKKCNKATVKKIKHWGYSSAGRAPALHAGGPRFDPA